MRKQLLVRELCVACYLGAEWCDCDWRDAGSIKFIVDLLRTALSSDDHKATSGKGNFSALELLNDLARIAVNDKNKLYVSAASPASLFRSLKRAGLPLLVTSLALCVDH